MLLGFAAMLAVFSVLTLIGIEVFHRADQITTVKPVVGVALALLLVAGPRYLKSIALAVFVTGVATRLGADHNLAVVLVPPTLVTLSVVGVYLALRRRVGPQLDFHNFSHLVSFMAVSVGVSAAVGVLDAAIMHVTAGQSLWTCWVGWIIPTSLGFVVFTPALVLASTATRTQFLTRLPSRIASLGLLVTALVLNVQIGRAHV